MQRQKQVVTVSLEQMNPDFLKQDYLALQVLQRSGVVPVLKVTRGGATTSLIKQSINMKKRVVIVEPTHRIGEKTVADAVRLSGNPRATVLQISENRAICKKLVDECQTNHRLQLMKWLLRPHDCEKCEYLNDPSCELQRILDCNNWDVIVLTYSKLKALTLSQMHSKVSQSLLAKLAVADLVINDEYTSGLLGLTPTVELSDDKYASLINIFFEGYDEWWNKIQIVACEALEKGKNLSVGRCQRLLNPLSIEDLDRLNANFIGMWNKVKRLTIQGVDTEFLQEMLQLASCKELLVRKDKEQHISIQPIEPLAQQLSYINSFADEFAKNGKLTLLVDAHLPEFNLQNYFSSKVDPFIWGDPNNTNNRIVYFCDSRKISEDDVYHVKTRMYLQRSIHEICKYHEGGGRPLIVCINKAVANEVERWQRLKLIPDVEVTWYRSVITRGIQADGNIQIMIGAPYIPATSYYFKVAEETGANKANAMNRAFRLSNMHAEFVNASSRVKDPKGIYQSYVYCLGITHLEVWQFLNLYGQMYSSSEVKRPIILSSAKTGMNPIMWAYMTKLYQRRNEICDPEDSLPYIFELTKILTKSNGKVRLQQAFRDKSGEAKTAFLKNAEFLLSIDIYVEKQGRGLILVLNDKNPL